MTTTETRTAPSSGAGRAAFIAAAAVGLGLFAFIGVRVKETLANRDTLTKELEAQKAKAGKREAIHRFDTRARRLVPGRPQCSSSVAGRVSCLVVDRCRGRERGVAARSSAAMPLFAP